MSPTWTHVPPRPDGSGTGRWRWLAALVVALAGPTAWAAGQWYPWWLVLAAGGVAVAVTRTRACRSFPAVAAVAVVAGAAVAPWTSYATGAWLAAVVVVSRWVAAPEGRPLGRPVPSAALPPAVALSAVSGLLGLRAHEAWVVAIPALAAVAVPLLITASGGRGTGWVSTAAHGVGRALTSLLFGLVAVPLVVVPGALARASGATTLDPTGRWSRAPRARSAPSGAWSNDRPSHEKGRGRLLSFGVVVLLLGVGTWVVVASLTSDRGERGFLLDAPSTSEVVQEELRIDPGEEAPPGLEEDYLDPGEVPAAVADDAWWRSMEYAGAQDFLMRAEDAWRFESPFRALDFRSRYLNVVDGIRQSWTPPPCECRRLTVWVYGGSTLWGIDQRDGHTIPSELARIAHENGLTVDVHNRGLPGLHHWLEAERFAWDLTAWPAPDLVVFYDGVNDRWSEMALKDGIFDAFWDNTHRSDPPPPEGPPGSRLRPQGDGLEPVEAPTVRGKERYDLTREMSSATAAQHGVPVRYFWQPDRYSRAFEPSEPHFDTASENDARLGNNALSAALMDDVVDLSDVLDGVRGPIFTDDVHHNERGARLIARAIFDHLEDDLRRLASEG